MTAQESMSACSSTLSTPFRSLLYTSFHLSVTTIPLSGCRFVLLSYPLRRPHVCYPPARQPVCLYLVYRP